MQQVRWCLVAAAIGCESGETAAGAGDAFTSSSDVAVSSDTDQETGGGPGPGSGLPPTGESLWTDNCVACHKADGSGTKEGPDLRPIIPLRTDEQLHELIRARMDDKGQPVFGHLTDPDLDLLVDYLRESFGGDRD